MDALHLRANAQATRTPSPRVPLEPPSASPVLAGIPPRVFFHNAPHAPAAELPRPVRAAATRMES